MQNRCYTERRYYQLYYAILRIVEIMIVVGVKSNNELSSITAIVWREGCANVKIVSYMATPKKCKTLMISFLIAMNPRD